MILNFRRVLPFILIFFFSFQAAAQESAKDIIKKAQEKMDGNSSHSSMLMRIERPDWSREIGIKTWAKGRDYSLILITAPNRDKGTAFLKRDREIWNWQPSIDRVIKLPPSMMMQSWMGSDFKNDDLVEESSIVEDYEHRIVSDTLIGERPCHKIELIPHEDAPVVWGKVLVYVDKKDYLQLLVKYYDEDDYLINTMVLSDIKAIGGRTIPTKMEMIPAEKENQRTVLIYQEMEFDLPIEDRFFSLQNMKRIR
ncbi:MAG: outer membrane lipoprotein-sorting protein [Bacteroidota bacterium]